MARDEGRAAQCSWWETAGCAGEWKGGGAPQPGRRGKQPKLPLVKLSPAGNYWKDTEQFTALLGRPRKPRESTAQKLLGDTVWWG